MMRVKDHSYSQNITNKKIAIFGIYPPPYGGVSVHIRRVADQLLQQHNRVEMYHTEQRLRYWFFPLYLMKLLFWLIVKRPDIVHYHSTYLKSSILELVWISIFKRLFRYTVTIIEHDCRHLYARTATAHRLYRRVVTRQDCHVVCIGSLTWKSYCDVGIEPVSHCVEHAFLPPVVSTADWILQTYPSSLFDFLKEYTPLIVVSAAHIMRIAGKDIYGLDQCVEMLAGIKATCPDAGLLIALPHVNNGDYFDELQKQMKKRNIAEQIYILQGNKELWPLFRMVDLFVRPTLSDGDSISVREALYFKVPVVASDVCERPDDVHCFKAGDSQDFIRSVLYVLQEYVYHPRGLGKTESVSTKNL